MSSLKERDRLLYLFSANAHPSLGTAYSSYRSPDKGIALLQRLQVRGTNSSQSVSRRSRSERRSAELGKLIREWRKPRLCLRYIGCLCDSRRAHKTGGTLDCT